MKMAECLVTSRIRNQRLIIIIAASMFISSCSILYLQPKFFIPSWDDISQSPVVQERDKIQIHDSDVIPKPTNKDSRSSSSSSSEGPVLVLHIGPHKTATSNIQCGLTYFRKDLLIDANVAYLGRRYWQCDDGRHHGRHKNKHPGFDLLDMSSTRDLIENCLLTDPTCKTSTRWKRLNRQLRYFSTHNVSVIISDEAFSRFPIRNDGDDDAVDNYRMLYNLFNKHYPGRVHVAIVYRRYFEWFHSKWNELNKPYKKRFRKWPTEGGAIPKIFRKYYEKIQNLKDSNIREKEGIGLLSYLKDSQITVMKGAPSYAYLSEVYNMHPAEYLRRLWNNYSNNVHILDMHEMSSKQPTDDGEDIATRFLRRILPSSLGSEVLATLKREGVGEDIERPNPSMNMDYDLIAVEAYQRGLLFNDDVSNKTKLERQEVAQMTEKFLLNYLKETTFDDPTAKFDIPMICLSETEQEKFLQRSLELERQVMVSTSLHKEGENDLWKHQDKQQQREIEHKSTFMEAVQRNKFCNVDTAELFKDMRVHNFFRELPTRKKGKLYDLWKASK